MDLIKVNDSTSLSLIQTMLHASIMVDIQVYSISTRDVFLSNMFMDDTLSLNTKIVKILEIQITMEVIYMLRFKWFDMAPF